MICMWANTGVFVYQQAPRTVFTQNWANFTRFASAEQVVEHLRYDLIELAFIINCFKTYFYLTHSHTRPDLNESLEAFVNNHLITLSKLVVVAILNRIRNFYFQFPMMAGTEFPFDGSMSTNHTWSYQDIFWMCRHRKIILRLASCSSLLRWSIGHALVCGSLREYCSVITSMN